MERKPVRPEQGIRALGPYSIGYQVGDTVFLSGITADMNDHSVADTAQQTRLIIESVEAILMEIECDLRHIVKTTVYLTNPDDYAKMNQMYAIYFTHPYPARSCVFVSGLPKGATICMDCIVVKGEIAEEIDEDCEGCCCD